MNLWQYRTLQGSSRIILLISFTTKRGLSTVVTVMIPENDEISTAYEVSPNSRRIFEISLDASSSRCRLHVMIRFKLQPLDLSFSLCLFVLSLIHFQSLQQWLTRPDWKSFQHQEVRRSLKIYQVCPLNH